MLIVTPPKFRRSIQEQLPEDYPKLPISSEIIPQYQHRAFKTFEKNLHTFMAGVTALLTKLITIRDIDL